MKSGDYVKFNENARPHYLNGNVARVVAANDHSVTIRVPSEGFTGDDRGYWTPGVNVMVPVDFVELERA